MSKVKILWTIDQKGVTLKVITADGKDIFLTNAFNDMEAFKKEVDTLCREIREACENAFLEWTASKEKMKTKEPQDPQEFWQILSKEPKESMIKLFNDQNESMRKLVAQYVFENVNVFSGSGAVFAELYDQETHRLEP